MSPDEISQAVQRIQLDFPDVYFACHVRHRQRRTTEHELSDLDVLYLGHLRDRSDLHPSNLARHLGLSASTLSAFLQRVEAHGYVARRTCAADRRQVELSLTAEGRAARTAYEREDGAHETR